jgi:hypothetical protein
MDLVIDKDTDHDLAADLKARIEASGGVRHSTRCPSTFTG